MHILNYIIRALCLVLYALAAAGQLVGLSDALVQVLRWLVLVMLLAHAAEVLIFLPRVRFYPGPLALSIVLTMLFGLFHWLPLKKPVAP